MLITKQKICLSHGIEWENERMIQKYEKIDKV